MALQSNKEAAFLVEQAKLAQDPAIQLIESAKQRAAHRAVEDYFRTDMRYVGIGSGTTIQYVVDAIKEKLQAASQAHSDEVFEHRILFIPTGFQSRLEIEKRGLIAVNFDSLPENTMLDVAFDGADEVDPELNCIKGGGACLFQEKLVAMKAKKFVCVADFRKDVPRLGTEWPYIPIEVAPMSVKPVLKALKALGSPNPELRTLSVLKAGPLKTDQDFYIIKAPFPPLLMSSEIEHEDGQGDNGLGEGQTKGLTKSGLEGRVWEAGKLATAIKGISGVLEVGLFVGMNGSQAARFGQAGGRELEQWPTSGVTPYGGKLGAIAPQGGQKPVAVYFGMQDGTVTMRKASGEE